MPFGGYSFKIQQPALDCNAARRVGQIRHTGKFVFADLPAVDDIVDGESALRFFGTVLCNGAGEVRRIIAQDRGLGAARAVRERGVGYQGDAAVNPVCMIEI